MNRSEFQALAIERLADAEALLTAGRYACAYYVSGYAIECAAKACIARRTNQDDFPPKDAARYYVHDIWNLLEIGAGLRSDLKEQIGKDRNFARYWSIVKDWSEETRYQSNGQQQAQDILKAIGDPDHGVLQWLQQNW